MTLKSGIGIGLLAAAWVSAISGNLVFWKMLEELAEKFPERRDYFFGNSTFESLEMFKFNKIWKLYKNEFPTSNRRKVALSLYIAALVALLTGFSMLATFNWQ